MVIAQTVFAEHGHQVIQIDKRRHVGWCGSCPMNGSGGSFRNLAVRNYLSDCDDSSERVAIGLPVLRTVVRMVS